MPKTINEVMEEMHKIPFIFVPYKESNVGKFLDGVKNLDNFIIKSFTDLIREAVPEKIKEGYERFGELFPHIDCCGKGEEEGFNVCRETTISNLKSMGIEI